MPYVNDSATFNDAIKMGKNTAIVVYIGNSVLNQIRRFLFQLF